MLTNNEVKYIQSLSQKKFRESEKLFVVEGIKMAEEVLNSNFSIHSIYATNSWAEKHPEIKASIIDESQLKKISNLSTPNEVLIVAHQKNQDEKLSYANQITLILDGIQDPGNFGTIIRTADWFGIKQIVASEDCVELNNPKVIQATMGSVFRISVHYANLLEELKQITIPVYGALLNGNSIYDVIKISEGVLVIGNESKGINENILSNISNPITIPKIGKAESLNAALATGIILSHLIK